jgi:hypothetical protein
MICVTGSFVKKLQEPVQIFKNELIMPDHNGPADSDSITISTEYFSTDWDLKMLKLLLPRMIHHMRMLRVNMDKNSGSMHGKVLLLPII